MIFFKTQKGQITLNFLFSFFAAVVIFAAMMKILHWQGADIAIMIGLMSETCVFSIMAFLVPPPEEPQPPQPPKAEQTISGSTHNTLWEIGCTLAVPGIVNDCQGNRNRHALLLAA